MIVELTTVDDVVRVLKSPLCVVFLHWSKCDHCKHFKPILTRVAEHYDYIPLYFVENDMLVALRGEFESRPEHNFMELTTAFPRTVMSCYGSVKCEIEGAVEAPEVEAMFAKAMAASRRDTCMPCAITDAEVQYFKHERGRGAVIEGSTFADIKLMLPVQNDTKLPCIGLITNVSKPRVLLF